MNLIELEKKYILQTYKRFPVIFTKGKGQYLWDDRGRKYLDFFSGLGVCNLGHSNKKILKAIKSQIEKFIHTSNLYYIQPQIKLAKILVEKTFKNGKVFFSNSGAEANECAIKLLRKFKKNGKIITFKNSFHGRTIATLTATGQEKFHEGFEPLLEGFEYAVFNDIDSVKKLIDDKVAGIFLEPIQGEGGVFPAKKEFIKEIKKICEVNNILLVFDEIQCGLGRTAHLFAYQYYNVEPDIITIAKGIANGLPLGVTIVKEKYANLFTPSSHGSTFGGNPVSCSSAIEVLNLLDKKLLSHIREISKYLFSALQVLKKKYSFIKEIRGVGLMVGIEFEISVEKIVKKCLEKGLIINSPKENVIRLLPPFIITKKDVDRAIKIFDESIYLNSSL